MLVYTLPEFTKPSTQIKGRVYLYHKIDAYSCCYINKISNTDSTENENAKRYTALCKHYGDITYNAERTYLAYYRGGYTYLEYNIVSINVQTETDFNTEYPAGSSLNDICVLEAESPYKHIKSGYTLTHDWSGIDPKLYPKDKGSIPFSKPLIECTAEDMILMGDGYAGLCCLKLTAMPTPGTEQQLTITLTDETGKVYTITTEPFTW